MLIIEDNTSGKIRKFATSDSELVDSLFNDGGGTLEKIHKITKQKNAVLYWFNSESGVFVRTLPTPLWGKFCKLKNGKKFYQHTLDKIKLTTEAGNE